MIDANEGHGGSYIIDPKTGVRKLVERTSEQQPEAEPVPEISNETPTPEKG